MPALAAGLDYLDLNFQGRAEIIATAVLHGPAGVALVDPGPSTTMATLTAELDKRGIRFSDVRQLLLTHIHLDHAGATGSITSKHPHIEVLVHERGARHLVDPSKLVASAARIYADDMDRLWGEILPVSASRIRSLAGGETISVVGRELKVEYTAGHASHHVGYLDTASHIAFVGDTAGIRRGSGTFVMPPTPPPDIDLEAWRESEKKILAWEPDTLFLTHFGPYHGARPHLQAMFETLVEWSRIVQRLLADGAASDDDRQQRFVDEAFQDLRRRVGDLEAVDYTKAGGLNFSYQGLARYWRKRHQP
ncbi:MAG TPA: MBL fold metallo-hydrolase [Vicinamibacterales bacterium]|jgi:glyoxylase-like metal-dependent hydrolase (beta-lactamase superfamily II)|nr:MBL fold metallo-hydrolase [Vicinamibacterales bacterium]